METLVNEFKTELCRLPLNPCQAEFIANNITPLVSTISQLTFTAFNLAFSVPFLIRAPYVKPDTSDIKDSIDLIYDLNEDALDIYPLLKRELKLLLNKGACSTDK